jgi:hypothetical protein
MRSKAKAFTGSYGDPGTFESKSSHSGVKSIVEEVVRDMGFRECELDNKLEVIEALLGDDGRQLLEKVPLRSSREFWLRISFEGG